MKKEMDQGASQKIKNATSTNHFSFKICRQLFIFLSCFILFSSSIVSSSFAIAYEGVRSVEWDSGSAQCRSNDNHVDGPGSDVNGIGFSPFSNNRDIQWELDNPTCIGFIVGFTVATEAASAFASAMCGKPYKPSPYMQAAQLVSVVGNGAQCAFKIGTASAAAATNAACGGCFTAQLAFAQADQFRCCAAYATQLAAYSAQLAALAVIYGVANQTYKRARVCGHDWQVWSNNDQVDANNKKIWSRGNYAGSYAKCLTDLFTGSDSCGYGNNTKLVSNQYYREYIYGGEEYTDSGSGACSLPSSWQNTKLGTRYLGYNSGNQRYYMRGPGLASNYACNRFLLGGSNGSDVQAAYNCCIKRSQNTICIEYAPAGSSVSRNTSYFCTAGSNCSISSVVFQAYQSKTNSNYVCAKTYSVCPYNHLLGGGTEMQDYGDQQPPSGIRQNFCQYMDHCVKVPTTPYVSISNLTGQFISQACRDLKGDSQNTYTYSSNLLPIGGRNFSAPIVQCFKETLENLMLNQAGSSICSDANEFPDQNGVCASGNYLSQKGQQLATQSFFIKVQSQFKDIVQMCLVLAIMFFGGKVLLGLGEIKRKELVVFIIKIGLVMYFAVGTGWQNGFVDGIMSASTYLADITTAINPTLTTPSLQDGCQFPKFNYLDITDTNSAHFAYPPGKDYLKLWDTLDCKIASAMGFGPEVSVPNLIMMIMAGFLTGGAGIIFLVAAFMFAFFLIFLTIRAIHIFLISSITITLLIYVSPITITASLFDKTKAIFDNWWKQLLGLVLQPMILFAYLGVLITIFDSVMIGNVTFSGDGRNAPKTINCGTGDSANNTSVYCIFNVAQIKTLNALAPIGIGLPTLVTSGLATKVTSLIKAALLMFIFTKFLDKIQELAISLVGGADLGANWGSAKNMTKKAFGALSGIQNRGMRAIQKHGGSAARSAGQKIGAMGNRGKGVKDDETGANRADGAGAGDKTAPDKAVPDKAPASGNINI